MRDITELQSIIDFIRTQFPGEDMIPLHAPVFGKAEHEYVSQTIESSFVSSVGQFVNDIEQKLSIYTGAKHVIATSNGTSALHAALLVAGVQRDDEILTQSLTFVATGNAIKYCSAHPVFIDVDLNTASLSPQSLERFFDLHTEQTDNQECKNKITGRIIRACIPMHSFGLMSQIHKIKSLCLKHNVTLIEDSAESLGSFSNNIHSGRFGKLGILSFNGNKIITSGGGGAIITDDDELGKLAKHITTTAKVPHKWEFFHDQIGYNYRMPNLNAALLYGQLEKLDVFIEQKNQLHNNYKSFFNSINLPILTAEDNTTSNYWLNTILLNNREERDLFLEMSNSQKVTTRPAWTLLHKMPEFKHDFVFESTNAQWLEDRIVNIPSSAKKWHE